MIRLFPLFVLLFSVAACAPTRFDTKFASGRYDGRPTQCVPFARDASGLSLRGDAWTWWGQTPAHKRGHVPVPGSVLVLSRTSRMPHGHVATVTRLIARDQIDVTHSNWGSSTRERSRVFERQRIADVSPRGDWSVVRFWNPEANTFGFPYAASGFIYR